MDDVEGGSAFIVDPGMGVIQALADLTDDVYGLIHRESDFHGPQDFIQVFAIDILHGDKINVFDFTVVENLDDIGMLQQCGQPRFARKHSDEVGVLGQMRAYALDGHLAPKTVLAQVIGFKELRHAAHGDLGLQVIGTDAIRAFHRQLGLQGRLALAPI